MVVVVHYLQHNGTPLPSMMITTRKRCTNGQKRKRARREGEMGEVLRWYKIRKRKGHARVACGAR